MADINSLSFGCGETLLAGQLNIMADAIRSLITLVGTIGDQVGNYIPLSGSEDISGVLAPDTNEGYDLGKSNKRWGTVWASVGGFKVIDFYDLQSPYGKLGRLEINQDGKLQYDGEPLALLSDINNEVNNDNQSFIHFGQNVRGRLDENYVRIPTSLKLDDVDDNEEAISNNYYNLYCGGINIKGTKFIQRGNYRFEEDDGEEHHTLCVRDGELLFDGNPIGSNPQLGNVLEGINELDLPESSKYLYYNYNNLSFEWANGTGGGVSYDSTDDRGKYLKVKNDGTGTEWVFASPGGGGVSSLNDLSGVSIDSSSEGQVLYYDGEKWTNSFISPNELPSYLKAGLNDYLKIGTGRIPEWAPDTMVHYLVNNNVVTDSVNIGNGVKDDTSSGTLGANQILARNFVTTRKLTILERDFTNNTSSNESFITIGTYGTVENNDQRKYILIDGSNVAGVDFKLSTNGQLCVNGNPIVFSQGTPTANLPNTSTDNDGQYLTVENGIAKWVSVTPGGVSSLNDLSDVSIGTGNDAPTNGQLLVHNGTNWVNKKTLNELTIGNTTLNGTYIEIMESDKLHKTIIGTDSDKNITFLTMSRSSTSPGDSGSTWMPDTGQNAKVIKINGVTVGSGGSGLTSGSWANYFDGKTKGITPTSGLYLKWDSNGNLTQDSGSYTLNKATDSALGGIKTGYAQNNKNYPVLLDTNNKAYVNVPWTASNLTLSGLVGSSSIGGQTTPIYWNGSTFQTCDTQTSGITSIAVGTPSLLLTPSSGSVTIPSLTSSNSTEYGVIKANGSFNAPNYPVKTNNSGSAYITLAIDDLMGSNAVGNSTTPIYWTGSAFSTCSIQNSGSSNRTLENSTTRNNLKSALLQDKSICVMFDNVGGDSNVTSLDYVRISELRYKAKKSLQSSFFFYKGTIDATNNIINPVFYVDLNYNIFLTKVTNTTNDYARIKPYNSNDSTIDTYSTWTSTAETVVKNLLLNKYGISCDFSSTSVTSGAYSIGTTNRLVQKTVNFYIEED